ncbi:MAG TPA: sporulation transcription factor Spo0A [Candidatus Pullichristensenella avicola]|nr:sporulation transcription factor Spo0A [Candidatus Pullichristensenella avicola]
MEKIRVIVADDNLSVLRLLTDYFAETPDIELVKTVSDGARVAEAVRAHRPDVLVTDIIMPRRDGFRILEELLELPEEERPRVIVLTGLSRDDFILRAVKLGASYYMVKPFDARLLANRIREVASAFDEASIAEIPAARENAAADVDEKITNLFLTIGIPAHIKGYHYLREAVRMVLASPEIINRITKELYPGIARKFDTTASKVERAMRHAIDVAWSRGRLDSVNSMYGYKVLSPDDKPTNGEFIALVADKVAVKKSA